jgi:hypothetical protein
VLPQYARIVWHDEQKILTFDIEVVKNGSLKKIPGIPHTHTMCDYSV